MGKSQRTKGHNFERLIARELKEIYPDAKRGLGQARNSGEVSDVEGTPWWIECKRWKRCNVQGAVAQAVKDTDGRPILVVTKDDGGDKLVTLHYTEFVKMTQHYEELLRLLADELTAEAEGQGDYDWD